MPTTPITSYGQEYLVIDMHNLFVSTTLADEILVLGGQKFLEEKVVTICAEFGINVSARRALTSYSGGEQALLCCVLLMHLLPNQKLRILLVHILDTLSEQNRQSLLSAFATHLPKATIYTLEPSGPQAMSYA